MNTAWRSLLGLIPAAALAQDPSRTRVYFDRETGVEEATAESMPRQLGELRDEIDRLRRNAGADDQRKFQALRDRVDRLAEIAHEPENAREESLEANRRRFEREAAKIRRELTSMREAVE